MCWSARRWSSPNVGKWIEGKQVRKVIVVPDKLVNIVAG